MKNYETGHAKNVANLNKLIAQISYYDKYDPPVKALTVENLTKLHNKARKSVEEAETRRAANKNAIHHRQDVYQDLKPLCTRIVSHLGILNLSDGVFDHARSINKRIQGYGTSRKPDEEVAENGTEETTTSISTSRQSYTQQAEHFSHLLTLIRTIGNYKPNEKDLQKENMDKRLADMNNATARVDQTEAALNTALRTRNEVLYDKDTGLYSRVLDVKKYVKSVYGNGSDQFSRITAIPFHDLR